MTQTEDDTTPIVSISSVISLCFIELNTLLEAAHENGDDKNNKIAETVQDNLGRLRLWAGNFGAHRKPTDRLSLDHRLREAQKLHQEVRDHLYDIKNSAHNARDIISSLTHPAQEEDDISKSDDSDSDDFWKDLQGDEEISEVEELLLDIGHAITSLYKFSITLQNPAHRDRSKQAARIDMRHYSAFDIQHASDKFGLPKDHPLIQRLGQANTMRRQILAYHKDHSGKISKYIDAAVDKAVMLSRDFDIVANSDRTSTLRQTNSDKAKSMHTASTQWTQNTTVSTIRPKNIENISDSGRTKFSSASSTNGNQCQTLTIPSPPDPENAVKGVPFICPYCVQLIQLENIEDDWHYHVFSDLRPYVCTFPDCKQESRLFDSYTEWSEHEWQFHRREWACHICPVICDTNTSFNDHIQGVHPGLIPMEQLQAIIQLSSRPTSSPQKCPLCTKPPVISPSRFQKHLARHLQQLSLFILPRKADDEYNNDIDSNQNAAGSDSQNALMSDSSEDAHSISTWQGGSSGHESDSEGSNEEDLGAEDWFNLEDNQEVSETNLGPFPRRQQPPPKPSDRFLKDLAIEEAALESSGEKAGAEEDGPLNVSHYVGYTFTLDGLNMDREDEGPSSKRFSMDLNQWDLRQMVRRQHPNTNQHLNLSGAICAAVEDAIKGLRLSHPMYEWTCRYAKEEERLQNSPSGFLKTPTMDIILVGRPVRPSDSDQRHGLGMDNPIDSIMKEAESIYGATVNRPQEGIHQYNPDDIVAQGLPELPKGSVPSQIPATPPSPDENIEQGAMLGHARREIFQCIICSNGHLIRDRGSFRRHIVDLHQAPEIYHCCAGLSTGRRDKARLHLAQRHGIHSPTRDDFHLMSRSISRPFECEVCHSHNASWDRYFECIRSHSLIRQPIRAGSVYKYEAWRLFGSEPLAGQESARLRFERTRIDLGQAELFKLVQTLAENISPALQYESLSITKRTAVHDLIQELQDTDPRYVRSCAYVKEQDERFKSKNLHSGDYEIVSMVVVLMVRPAQGFPALREAFQCVICSSPHIFHDRGSFRRHVVDKHQRPELYACPCGLFSSGRRDKARLHLAQSHGQHQPGRDELNAMTESIKGPFPCEICRTVHISWEYYFSCIRGHCLVNQEPGDRGSNQGEVDEIGPGDFTVDNAAPPSPSSDGTGWSAEMNMKRKARN